MTRTNTVQTPRTDAPPTRSQETAPGPIYRSTQLFQGERLVWIEHGNERYALRVTKQGKLILTK